MAALVLGAAFGIVYAFLLWALCAAVELADRRMERAQRERRR